MASIAAAMAFAAAVFRRRGRCPAARGPAGLAGESLSGLLSPVGFRVRFAIAAFRRRKIGNPRRGRIHAGGSTGSWRSAGQIGERGVFDSAAGHFLGRHRLLRHLVNPLGQFLVLHRMLAGKAPDRSRGARSNRRLQQGALAGIVPVDAFQDRVQVPLRDPPARALAQGRSHQLQAFLSGKRITDGPRTMIQEDRLHDLHERLDRARRHAAGHVVELLVAGRRRTILGLAAGFRFLLHFDLQAASQHGDHRMLAVERLGRVQLVAGTVQQAVPLAPEKELQMLLDVVGLHGGLFLPIAFAQVMAEELDARRADLQFLVGQGHRVSSRRRARCGPR